MDNDVVLMSLYTLTGLQIKQHLFNIRYDLAEKQKITLSRNDVYLLKINQFLKWGYEALPAYFYAAF